MTWTDNLGSSQDYTTILDLLTQPDGESLEIIYKNFKDWCDEAPQESVAGFDAINSVEELLTSETFVAMDIDPSTVVKLTWFRADQNEWISSSSNSTRY
jgi:hypothetical protein